MMDDGFPGLFKHTTNSQLTHLQSPKLLVSQECFFMGCNHSMCAMELGTKILRLLFILFYFQDSGGNACKNHNQISVRSTMENACS
ncbi:unnamed protein product, partial [Musa textilis]